MAAQAEVATDTRQLREHLQRAIGLLQVRVTWHITCGCNGLKVRRNGLIMVCNGFVTDNDSFITKIEFMLYHR